MNDPPDNTHKFIGIDAFPLAILEKTYPRPKIMRLAMLAQGYGPFANEAVYMLSDALDGGVTEIEDGCIGTVARLAPKVEWIQKYIAIKDHPEMPDTIEAAMIGRDASEVFGSDLLKGRTIIETGRSEDVSWWAMVDKQIEWSPRPGIFMRFYERLMLTPRLMKNALRNATATTGRYAATASLVCLATMCAIIIVNATEIILEIRMALGLLPVALLLRLCNWRNMEAQQRVERRSNWVTSFAA